MGQPGRLRPPYGQDHCANAGECGVILTDQAWLFSNVETGKLAIVCGDCHVRLELDASSPWRLVPL